MVFLSLMLLLVLSAGHARLHQCCQNEDDRHRRKLLANGDERAAVDPAHDDAVTARARREADVRIAAECAVHDHLVCRNVILHPVKAGISKKLLHTIAELAIGPYLLWIGSQYHCISCH